MWPLGYILGSQYSPLHLEQQIPTINWRDSFEDLLALESGKKMISAASREREAATASRIRNESVHNDISFVNQELQHNQDIVVLQENLRKVSLRTKDPATVSMINDEALPHQKKLAEMAIANGKALIASLTNLQNKPASSYKFRVPWITSLISSGAMPDWESVVYDSSDGFHAEVYKASSPGDCHVFTELDLTMIFERSHALDFRYPTWSTYDGLYNNYYPQIEQLCSDGDADPDAQHAYNTIDNIRPSILSQLTMVQQRKSWNGTIEMRVVLKNRFTEGREEEKTIVNDASKVLEEVEKAHASVKGRHHAISLAIWELSYRKQKESLAAAMDKEDMGVE